MGDGEGAGEGASAESLWWDDSGSIRVCRDEKERGKKDKAKVCLLAQRMFYVKQTRVSDY